MDAKTIENAANVAVIVTPLVIAAGFIFAYAHWKVDEKQNRAIINTRLTETVLRLFELWESPEMRKGRARVNVDAKQLKIAIEEADKQNSDILFDLVVVANYFDSLGVLVIEGCMSCSIAYDFWKEPVYHYHNVYKTVLDDPKHSSKFSYFIERHRAFKEEEEKRHSIKHHSSE